MGLVTDRLEFKSIPPRSHGSARLGRGASYWRCLKSEPERARSLRGVDILADAVKVTLGPKGHNEDLFGRRRSLGVRASGSNLTLGALA